MIRRIELVNFMSHEHTVIEPAEGLTVLVGPNNCGKSAVVTALQILCHNDNSTYVTRHGERECHIKVKTDDGHVIEWARRDSPRYTIDGQLFDRLRSSLPVELFQTLRLPKVNSDGDQEFDVHFGEQKSPVFLIDKPSSHAARFFSSSSDAGLMVRMQNRHRAKTTAAKQEQTRLANMVGELSGQIKDLEPVSEINVQVEALEKDYTALRELNQEIADAGIDTEDLQRQGALLLFYKSQAETLSELQSPPQLEPIEPLQYLLRDLSTATTAHARFNAISSVTAVLPSVLETQPTEGLEDLIGQIKRQEQLLEKLHQQKDAVALLSNPPALQDESQLEELIEQLLDSLNTLGRHEQTCEQLNALTSVPQMLDLASLTDVIVQMESQSSHLKQSKHNVETIAGEIEKAQEALKEWAQEHRICPTCGGQINPEQMVKHAGTLGGHFHA
jgi:exonuclease SbcC